MDRLVASALFAGSATCLVLGALRLDTVPYAAVSLWAAFIVVTELAPVSLPGGGRLTVSPVLEFAGLLVFGPVPTAWAALVGTLGAAAIRPANAGVSTWLRLGVAITALYAAGGVWQLREGARMPLTVPDHLLTLLAVGTVYGAVVSVGNAIVTGRRRDRSPLRVWRANLRWTGVLFAALLPLGVVTALLYVELHLLGVLLFVSPILLARHAFRLYTETRLDVFDFVETLTDVIEQVDPYTRHHSSRVSHYARQIAVEMKLKDRLVDVVATAGLLHDLGKVSFKTADIMESPNPLTDDQWARMTRHPSIGADIVSKVRMFRDVSDIVRFHHERVDGRGYPYGIRGEDIPLGARILTVADTLDAMTSDRAYRRALRLDEALREFRRLAGAQFDAEVVAAVERLVARGELRVLYDRAQDGRGLVPVLEAGGR